MLFFFFHNLPFDFFKTSIKIFRKRGNRLHAPFRYLWKRTFSSLDSSSPSASSLTSRSLSFPYTPRNVYSSNLQPKSTMPLPKYTYMLSKTKRWRCHLHLLPEWITPIVSAILFIILELKNPFERQFVLSDLNISHKMAEHERVPVWLLGVSLQNEIFFLISFSILTFSRFFSFSLLPFQLVL